MPDQRSHVPARSLGCRNVSPLAARMLTHAAGSLCLEGENTTLTCGNQLACTPLLSATTQQNSGLLQSGFGFCNLRAQSARSASPPGPSGNWNSDDRICDGGCIAGLSIAAVVCAVGIGVLAGLLWHKREQRMSGAAAAAGDYGRFHDGGLPTQPSSVGLMKLASLPSVPDPKLQRGTSFMSTSFTSDAEAFDGKTVELTPP